MSTIKIIDNAVIQAAKEYLSRKERKTHPDGDFDKAGRWYPSGAEKCKACSSVREPSRAYPFSIMTHCRSIGHIATKYQVDAAVLRKVSGQVLRSAKVGLELSVLEAADIVVDKNKNYIFEQDVFDEISPEHRISTTQAKPVGDTI